MLDWLKMFCNRFGKAFDRLANIDRQALDLRAEKIAREQSALNQRMKTLEARRTSQHISIEERKIAALENISEYLRVIADSLANIAELALRKR